MINRDLLNYRESVRHLFNLAILPLIENLDDFNEQFDIIDDFRQIETLLFKNMVLNTNDITGQLSYPIEIILLRPQHTGTEILIENHKGDNNRYWDYLLNRINPEDIRLCFIDFYDYDLRSLRNYSFYRAKILDCVDKQVIGREALCPVSYYEAYSM